MKDMIPEYIEELNEYDSDMLAHNLAKRAKDYKAISVAHAVSMTGEFVDRALQRAGVHITPDSSEHNVKFMLKEHGVQVENRTYYKSDEAWRRGLYIYKNMDLIGFISEPMFKKPGFLEADQTPSIVVRSVIL